MLRKVLQDEIAGFYSDFYAPYIEEIKAYGGGSGMTENVLRLMLCNEPFSAYIISSGKEDVGFLMTEKVSPPSIYRPMLFLVEFSIKKEFRRKGIGTMAFKELLSDLDTPIFFTVLPGNEGASAFWRRQIALNDLVPVNPDKGQIMFAQDKQLYCFETKK